MLADDEGFDERIFLPHVNIQVGSLKVMRHLKRSNVRFAQRDLITLIDLIGSASLVNEGEPVLSTSLDQAKIIPTLVEVIVKRINAVRYHECKHVRAGAEDPRNPFRQIYLPFFPTHVEMWHCFTVICRW